jgi:hypothetical protein
MPGPARDDPSTVRGDESHRFTVLRLSTAAIPEAPVRPPGQGGQHPRVALPGGHRPDHVLRGQGGQLAGHGGDLDQGRFEQLFHPLEAAGPLLDQPGPHPGVIPQVPDRLGRHEGGPQQSHLGQPGQPHRIQLVRLRPAGQAPGLGRVNQLDC